MSDSAANRAIRIREVLKPVAVGIAVLMIGLAPWWIMAPLNAGLRPDLPWAAAATAAFLMLFLAWLNGAGPPRGTCLERRNLLRLNRAPVAAAAAEHGPRATSIILMLALLYMGWILVGGFSEQSGLDDYPTAYGLSVLVMGAAVSGIVEEAAFRGYMQRGLERFGPHRAILITSGVFTLLHGVHGLEALLLLAPGLFFASWLYGWLAWRTGSIVPGMIIHVLGDFAYFYFDLFGGDYRLLFAP